MNSTLDHISDRELDGWIAENLCGWTNVVVDSGFQVPYQARGVSPEGKKIIVPAYSSNEVAAAKALKALALLSKRRGYQNFACLITTAYASALCNVTKSAWAPSMGFGMLAATPREICEAIYSIRNVLTAPACVHEWVSGDRDGSDGGPKITGLEVCVKCCAFRTAAWVGEREQA